MTLGIIGGTSLFGTKTEFLEAANEREVDTKYGTVYLISAADDDVVFIPRHGKPRNIPPHRMNYKAYLAAFKDLGVENIIGVTSVGSLKRDIKPQSLIVPHDYISLCSIPTFYDNEIVHVTPGLDAGLRDTLIKVAKGFGDIGLVEKGVYFQTVGPRLETRAEIDFIRNYADVIGMNMASEATLAKELGLRYANISSVDNYAHGIIDEGEEEELDYKQIVEAAAKNREKLELLLMKLIDALQGSI